MDKEVEDLKKKVAAAEKRADELKLDSKKSELNVVSTAVVDKADKKEEPAKSSVQSKVQQQIHDSDIDQKLKESEEKMNKEK